MIAKLCNRARKIPQSPTQIARHCVRSVSGKVHLSPAATALNLDPNAVTLAGDNGRIVHENSEILHKAAPLKFEGSLYPVGTTKRVLKVKNLCLDLSGRDASKLTASQLLTERNSGMRGEAELLNFAAAIKADTDNLPIRGNNRRSANEFTGHANKLLWPLDRNTIAPARNPSSDERLAQPLVCIAVFLRNTLFEFAGLQLHLVGHADKLRRVNTQACRPLNTVVSFGAAFPRRHLNHSHKSASYSHADNTGLVDGVTLEPSRNFRRTS